ncbi:ABC transporter transmembrane domain-containing protein [uncultured Thalassospira sp.]|uniref:peptidase domain-containing ABC transporter n=1 Tax=uncultured Thalassospira sp. TaxID=404382 RepID=UPI002597133C|nr:ABC transporter transmembrane domain-containing protein [uncultured Thalassospira sp.]|tara:strand:+ start:1378 stop:3099 length:1722 start_codon:yes stop_codon:yes gene_type:complete
MTRRPGLNIGTLSHLRTGRFSLLIAALVINLLSLALPITLLQVYDRVLPHNSIPTLTLLILGVLGALLIEAVLRLGRAYISSLSAAKFEHESSQKAVGHLLSASLIDYDKTAPGLHLQRLNSLNLLRDFYSGQAIGAIVDLPFVVLFLALIAVIGGVLVAVPVGILLAFFLAAMILGHQLRAALDKRSQSDERRYNFIIETLTGIHTIKSMAMENLMVRRHEQLQEQCSGDDLIAARSAHAAVNASATFSMLTMVMVAAIGSVLVINGDLTVGGLAACTMLSGRSIQPLQRAMSLWTQFQNIRVARQRVNELFEIKPEDSAVTAEMPLLEGKIELRNLGFSHADGKKIFDRLDLVVQPGDSVAITGDNGTGKTTLLWLLMGALRPDSGDILLDGKNPSDYTAESTRRQIAYLPQHGVMFKGTILENITGFRKEIGVDRVVEIARRLGLDDIVMRMPEGYDTEVGGQASETLPRGVKQRIAVARALIDYPRIVLFDEANSSLDMAGDNIMASLMLELKKHCTLVMVSHRPSLIALANKQYRIVDHHLVPVLKRSNARVTRAESNFSAPVETGAQ